MDLQSDLDFCKRQLSSATLHPALSESHELGPDIYRDLLTGLLDYEYFEYWHQSKEHWVLRYSGSPGSGKTTLAELARQRLFELYPTKDNGVASVFIIEDVRWNEATFIEDFLVSILRQLMTGHTCNNDNGQCSVSRATINYLDARNVGQRGATRIRLIRNALDQCISSLGHAFLVLDGIDRCSPAVDLFLEDELPRLRERGLKILTTSRIPCLTMPFEYDSNCDYQDEECPSPYKRRVYWTCVQCDPDGNEMVICAKCKERGCPNCEGHDLKQPHTHVNADISCEGGQLLAEFIAQALEQEHGDLGLGTKPEKKKPPRSRLGSSLIASPNKKEAISVVQALASRSENNIALARARLDLIDAEQTLEEFRNVGDRLPASITALFDAGIKVIEEQSQDQRDLGLRSIAAAALCKQHDGNKGVELESLNHWLGEAASLVSPLPSRMAHMPHRGLDEILQASKGYLIVEAPVPDEPIILKPYHGDFATYAAEGYNESLVWAASQLRFGRLADGRRISRVRTFAENQGWNRNERVHKKDFQGNNNSKISEPLLIKRTETGRFVVNHDADIPIRPIFETVQSEHLITDNRGKFKITRSNTSWQGL